VGAFGEKLRKQREQRGIALDAISNTTKISTRMLRALEDEHFDQLPGGVFNKGFVRAYARQVGLDEEEAIADYLAALRESQIQAQSVLPDFHASAAKPSKVVAPHRQSNDLPDSDLRNNDLRNRDLRTNDRRNNDPSKNDPRGNTLPGADGSNDRESRRADRRKEARRHKDSPSLPDSSTHAPANPRADRFRQKYPAGSPTPPADDPSARIPWGKLAVALLLVTFALALWNSRRHGEPAAASHPAAASNPSPAPVSAPVSATMSAAKQPSHSARPLTAGKASPAGTLSSGSSSPRTISAATTPPTATSASPALPAAAVPASSRAALSTTESTPPTTNGSTTGPATGSTNKAAANPTSTFTLLIRAEKTAWVSIMADGKPVAQETLIAPAHTSARASGEIVVKTGNAAGISFLLNGKEIPAQGNDGEVKTYVFDASGVRVQPQTQPPASNR
jgi:hypothetical protein